MNITTASTVARYLNAWRNRPTLPARDEWAELLRLRADAFRAIALWAAERGRLETEAAAWGIVADSREQLVRLGTDPESTD